jgi:uncharacterized protein Smg (DUF494 family)
MEPINPELLEYISECRKLGYEDFQIRIPLLDHGWELHVIQEAFEFLKKEEEKKLKKKEVRKDSKTVYVYKNSYTIHLDSEVAKLIEKRAKKNMLKPEEQIEDIVRRSCVSLKKKDSEAIDNVDDIFLRLFSRKSAGRAKK